MTKLTTSAKKKAKRNRRLNRIAAAVGCPLEFLKTLGAHWTEEQAREAWESYKADQRALWSPIGAEIGASIRRSIDHMRLARRFRDADYSSLEARILANTEPMPEDQGTPTGRLRPVPPSFCGIRPGVKSDPRTMSAFLEQARTYYSMGARQPADTCSICGHRANTPQEFCEHLKSINLAYEGLESDPKFQATSEALREALRAGYLPGKPEMAKDQMLFMLSQVVTPAAKPGTITIMADGSVIAPEGVKISVDPADERGDFTVRAEYEYRCAEDPESGEPKLRSIGILKGIGEPPHE